MKSKVVMQSQKVKHYFWIYLMMLSFAMIIVLVPVGKSLISFNTVITWILLFMENKLFLQFN